MIGIVTDSASQLPPELADVPGEAWRTIVAAAEDHYVPGAFTTFIGYEWTSKADGGGHLHRNVIYGGSRIPDFPFSAVAPGTEDRHENITTACFIGRRMFRYGYMEIRCKAADAEVTSSFWATGNHTELGMFEMFGDHRQPKKLGKDRELWWSIHDWSPEMKGKTVYTEHHDLGFRVAGAFHTYGIKWSEGGIKYHVDGKLATLSIFVSVLLLNINLVYWGGFIWD